MATDGSPKTKVCWNCHGRGTKPGESRLTGDGYDDSCQVCHGTGWITPKEGGCLTNLLAKVLVFAVLPIVVLFVVVNALVIFLGGEDDPALSPASVSPSSGARGATVGSCFATTGPDTLAVVPCDQAHQYEVFHIVGIESAPNDDIPEREAMAALANRACPDPAVYVGADLEALGLSATWVRPTEETWASNQRTIECVIVTGAPTDPQTTVGSVRAG
jgi:hypothetical protein